jgi:hypothetical protein
MIHEASRDFCKVFSDNGADSIFGADSYLEEERGALHEGLSKTLESLRRGSW